MFIQIAPKVKVFVSVEQVDFIQKHSQESFKASQLSDSDAHMAKVLADKAVFVRKKLDNDVQYALNRRVRFLQNGDKK